jgi:hypothetical protein
MAGIDGKVGTPPDLLIGARLAERLAVKPWLTAEHLDAPQFSRRSKREEEHKYAAYKDHRPSVAEHCWHAVTLWLYALVVYDTCPHTSRRYPCNARQCVEKQRMLVMQVS